MCFPPTDILVRTSGKDDCRLLGHRVTAIRLWLVSIEGYQGLLSCRGILLSSACPSSPPLAGVFMVPCVVRRTGGPPRTSVGALADRCENHFSRRSLHSQCLHPAVLCLSLLQGKL